MKASRGPADGLARALPAGLIVSCQARGDHPLRDPRIIAAMALAAERGGAVGIRAAGAEDIAAVRRVVGLPIIGLTKTVRDDSPVIITGTIDEAAQVVAAGADVVAIDASGRPRPGGLGTERLIGAIHDLGLPVLADIDTREAALAAIAAGADAVATTLAGYTGHGAPPEGPDLDLLALLAAELLVPVVGEGRFSRPGQVEQALRSGAHAVVVGTAITDPVWITQRFAAGAARGLG